MAWAALAAGGASLAGSALGFISAQNAQAEQARIAQGNWDIQREMATRNEYLQQLFASNQLQWKAQDARNAGIHPVFAMGAQPFVPQGSSAAGTQLPSGDGGGEFLARMGQDVGRAITAYQTHQERKEALSLQSAQMALATERAALENQRTVAETDLIRSQIARMATNPPFPSISQRSPGGGNSGDMVSTTAQGTFEMKPPEIHNPNPQNVGTTAGPSAPSVQWVQNSFGALQPYPDKNLKVEDEFGAPLMARWLLTEAAPHNWRSNNIPESVWKERFPGAIGVQWSYRNQGYVPIYPGHGYKADMFRSISSHGQGGVHPYSRYTPGIRHGLNSLR